MFVPDQVVRGWAMSFCGWFSFGFNICSFIGQQLVSAAGSFV